MRTEDLRVLIPITRRSPRPDRAQNVLSQQPSLAAPGLAVLAACVLVLLVFFGSSLVGQRAQHRQLDVLAEQVQQLQSTPVQPPAAATYASAAAWLDVIAAQENDGDWQAAFDNAQVALALAGLSAQDRQALANKAVADGVEALFAIPLSPADTVAQRQTVASYQSLKRLAAAESVTFPYSPRQIASRAYTSQAFLLAKAAFDEAVDHGQIGATDLSQLQFYTDTLYNLGWWWAGRAQPDERAEGLSYLAASFQLDCRYELGRGHAGAALREILGPDESAWPAPAAVSFLPDNARPSAARPSAVQ